MKNITTLFKVTILSLLLSHLFVLDTTAQYVRTSGKKILDKDGKNLIFRGIGTGNWMLQEGYMMNSANVAGTQWQFRKKLIETIGEQKTNEFYNKWWDSHFREIDVDSMAKWGFNSVRLALHYKMLTLPIEEEPIPGNNTWLESGFSRLDSLLQWCAKNQIYLILDMHGAPGGQGEDSNISDYDSSKPSLWESEENKLKLIALWKKIAKRYSTNPWIGGYDLINEPNWTLPNNNKALWDLQKRITLAIREEDNNHLIVLNGNSWSNDYNGLPNPLWDNNIVLSFHKYWTYNDENAINWILDLGNRYNVPIWLGESGENSNTWFTDLISLCERNNVGWSWWPVKKTGINNILQSNSNSNYEKLIKSWENNTKLDTTQAFNAVLQFAEDHKFENCIIHYDVIDALITRPHTNEVRPFKKHSLNDTIFAVDYDFGPIGKAYFDADDANYHLNENQYTTWNKGWVYRNDGVDIQICNYDITNGYAVAWIEDGEWLNYTIQSEQTKAYAIQLCYAAEKNGAKVYIEVNGKRASKTVELTSTGSWDMWEIATIPNVIIPSGNVKIKFVFEKSGLNFNYFKFNVPKDIEAIPFNLLEAETEKTQDKITLFFNKEVEEFTQNSFSVKVNNEIANVISVKKNDDYPEKLTLLIDKQVLNKDIIAISYEKDDCKSGGKNLTKFNDYNINNKILKFHVVDEKIEAENFAEQSGFEFENCEDEGGGKNTSHASVGDYLDYLFFSNYEGEHEIELRVAVNTSSARLAFYDITDKATYLKQKELTGTGGWQVWETQKTSVKLKKGKNQLRIRANSEGFNINWIKIREVVEAGVNTVDNKNITFYPNPVSDILSITSTIDIGNSMICLFNSLGQQVLQKEYSDTDQAIIKIDMNAFPTGVYNLKIINQRNISSKVIIKK